MDAEENTNGEIDFSNSGLPTSFGKAKQPRQRQNNSNIKGKQREKVVKDWATGANAVSANNGDTESVDPASKDDVPMVKQAKFTKGSVPVQKSRQAQSLFNPGMLQDPWAHLE